MRAMCTVVRIRRKMNDGINTVHGRAHGRGIGNITLDAVKIGQRLLIQSAHTVPARGKHRRDPPPDGTGNTRN
jgi:hypothetical protein